MKFGFVIFVAIALPGCADHELKKLTAVRDEVCACKTVACAETALEKVPSPKNAAKSTPRTQAAAQAMLKCVAEIYQADRPTLDPDAEPAPTAP